MFLFVFVVVCLWLCVWGCVFVVEFLIVCLWLCAVVEARQEHWAWMIVLEVRQGTLGVEGRG